MRPRLRLFYSAIICSFVPYLAREAYTYFGPSYGLQPLDDMTWIPHLALGAVCGAILVWLTLSNQTTFVLGGAAIGLAHSSIYVGLLKTLTRQPAVEAESRFVDKDYKL